VTVRALDLVGPVEIRHARHLGDASRRSLSDCGHRLAHWTTPHPDVPSQSSSALNPAFLGAVPHAPGIGAGKGLVIEMVLTFFLVWAAFATAVDPRGAFKSIAGLAIGLTITMGVFRGGPVTGGAMDPARAFGPEAVGGFWDEAWIYWVGPLAGALVAGLVYEWLYLRPVRTLPVGLPESGVEEPRPGDAAAG
jgi:glycerol uptake facilitator-like aquaporin